MKTLQNQNLLDVTLQETGDLANLFDLVEGNGLSLTAEINAGTEISVSVDEQKKDFKVLKFYDKKEVHPATDNSGGQGIGYWSVPFPI